MEPGAWLASSLDSCWNPLVLSYTIDAEGRIAAIEGAWDEFAEANGAPQLSGRNVIGTRLLDHVVGLEAREVTSLLVWRARSGHHLSVAFRCDAPARRRFLRLDLTPLPGDSVLCSTTLLSEEDRPAQPLLDPRVPRSGDLVTVCSWCRRVRAGERWVEIEEAVQAMGLLLEPQLPAITHAICPRCGEDLRRA
jgi:hypothetical protein